MKITENHPFVTLRAFCAKHPELADEARNLVKNDCIQKDSGGRFSEKLLRTAAMVRAGKLAKTGRYTADLK